MKTEAAKYFYTTATGRNGPVGFDELRALAVAGTLTRRHKVWCEGMGGWETTDKIKGLFAGLPPDLDNEPQGESSPPVSSPSDKQDRGTSPAQGDASSLSESASPDREPEKCANPPDPIPADAPQPGFDATRTTLHNTTRTCGYCGRVGAEAATHCLGCGTELTSAPADKTGNPPVATPTKMRRMILVCSGAITLVLVGIFFTVHRANEMQVARELHAAQDEEALGKARGLIAAGLQEIVYENAGDNIAFDSGRLPSILDKWEKAALMLETVQPADASDVFKMRDELNQLLAVTRTCSSATTGTERKKAFEAFVWTLAAFTSAHGFEFPFSVGVTSPRSALSRVGSPGNNVASTSRAEITGMFGLKLGDQLPARLVRKIDGWQDMAEVGAYCVNPPEPSDIFDTYTVQLLGGPIHKISASRNGRGEALANIHEDARKYLTSRFGPPTSTVVVDARGGSGIAWEQNLRYGGRVQMTLTMAKDSTFASGAIIPGTVRLDIQKL